MEVQYRPSNISLLDAVSMEGLTIPSYQRPYSWTSNQVERLLIDLKEHFEENRSAIPYLMGTLILHETKIEYSETENKESDFKIIKNIVDGQQRIVTFTILLKNFLLPDKIKLQLLNNQFINRESQYNIYHNNIFIENWLVSQFSNDGEKEKFGNNLIRKNQVYFTYITVDSVENAFQCFDSQNSKGKALSKQDLLKAHHLRFIDDEDKAQSSSKDWEKMEEFSGFISLSDNIGLTRTRARDKHWGFDLMEEFKATKLRTNKRGKYELSRFNQPPIFESWEVKDKKMILRLKDAEWSMPTNKSFQIESNFHEFLPIHLLEPLEGGEPFFLYFRKYFNLSRAYFGEDGKTSNHNKLYFKLHKAMSKNYYIQIAFEYSLLLYIDKFQEADLDEFAFEAMLYWANLRYSKANVQYRSVPKYIRENTNIFSCIYNAPSTKFAIDKIKSFVLGLGVNLESRKAKEAFFEAVDLNLSKQQKKRHSQLLK